jgi:DNA-binding transcriptional LysR family regulator
MLLPTFGPSAIIARTTRKNNRSLVALAGLGIILKSEVDVTEDLAAGRLERVLSEWDGGEAPVIALYPSAQHVPLKTRALLDEFAAHIAA